jgi:putative SOS response-associated peptidase YedK
MLTVEPGPDVAPYHNRQVAVIDPADWRRWLDASASAVALLGPGPAGTFAVARA